MRTMTFLAGAGVGYALGARAGREQYEKIQEFARKTAERPEVRRAVEKATPLADKVTTMASEKIPGIGGEKADAEITGTSSTGTGTADDTAAREGNSSSSSDEHSSLPPRGTFDPVRGTF